MQQPLCPVCGEAFPPRPIPGRPRRYCSGRCRTEAYRIRQASTFIAEHPPTPAHDADPIVRAELLAAADALLKEGQSAPPEDRLVRTVIEARTIAYQFARLEPELPPGLAWRAARAAEGIESTIIDAFPIEGVTHD